MATSIHTDQIIISLAEDGSVRGINVYAVARILDETGKQIGASAIPPRDATLADVTGILAPALVTQQAQIAALTAQLTTAQAATTAAQDDAATKATTIEQLQAQIAALTEQSSADGVPTITRRQLLLWLLDAADLTSDMVEDRIAAIPDPKERARAQIEWGTATEYKHDHPLVLQIGAALGLDQKQIDQAFRSAALY